MGPTNASTHPVGKQRLDPSLIWYTPVNGIWQTVWLEPVKTMHIASVAAVADIDHGTLTVKTAIADARAAMDEVQAVLTDGNTSVATGRAPAGQDVTLSIPSPKLWDPQHPFLYGPTVTLWEGGDNRQDCV